MIMGNQQELATQLSEVAAQVAKIGKETKATLSKVAELETALANQENVSPELQAAFDGLKTQVTLVDGLVPDLPAAEVTTEPVNEAQPTEPAAE